MARSSGSDWTAGRSNTPICTPSGARRRSRGVLGFVTAAVVMATACVGSDPATSSQSGADAGPATQGQPEAGGGDSGVVTGQPGVEGGVDSGTDSSTPLNEAGGPWSPTDIKGLVLWLDGDAATANVNGTVDTWNDKSTFKNHAKTTTDAQKPVLLTAAGSINGHQALRFDGTSKFFTITDSVSLQWSESFVIEAVFRHNAPATGIEFGPIYSKVTAQQIGASGPLLGIGADTSPPHSWTAEIEVSPSAFIAGDAFSVGAPHRVRAGWDLASKTLSIQIDKATVVSAVENSVTGLATVGRDALIGNNQNNQLLTADLAEIVAIARTTVDPADVALLQAYLDKKYGL
jgi:hypothetical protein